GRARRRADPGDHLRLARRRRRAPAGRLDERAVGPDGGDLDEVAEDVDLEVVVDPLEVAGRLHVDARGARLARVQRRAAAAGDEVADAVVLGAPLVVVVAGEHRGDLVLLEQRGPRLA